MCVFLFSSRRRHTSCALVTGVQTCALPIYLDDTLITASLQPREAWRRAIDALPDRPDALDAMRAAELIHAASRWFWSDPVRHREGRLDIRRARHGIRSEEHTSELQSLMRISYAVFCLKKKKKHTYTN